MAYQQKCTEYTGIEDMLVSEGILKKPMGSHEAMEYIIHQLKERLNGQLLWEPLHNSCESTLIFRLKGLPIFLSSVF